MIGRALAVAGVLFMFAGTVAGAESRASSAKEQLRNLKSRIAEVQKRLAEAEESRTEAADALAQSERAISDANRTLSELSQKAQGADATLAALRRETERAQAEVRRQQDAFGKLLYQQYAAGRPETLGVLLNGGDANEIARRLHYLTYIAQARSQAIAKVRAELARVAKLADAAERQATTLAAITRDRAEQRRRLQQEKATRAQVLARVSRDVEQQRRRIGTLKRDQTRLTRLVEQLSRVIAQTPRQQRPPQPPSQGERQSEDTAVTIDQLPQPGNGGFAALRGRLALPVRGELANRFGSPRQGGGVVWKGLFIAAREGEEVRAIAPGRVVYADWLRGFGNLLIIDHGDSYLSLYGYNETLFKQVGDVIQGGERVAAVGNSGGQAGSGLYFEIRHEGRPFDPMTWVSVR